MIKNILEDIQTYKSCTWELTDELVPRKPKLRICPGMYLLICLVESQKSSNYWRGNTVEVENREIKVCMKNSHPPNSLSSK